MDVLRIFALARARRSCSELSDWWPTHLEVARLARTPIEAALSGGAAADRLAFAFASGYQAALRALVPALDPTVPCALAVTEVGGNSPSAMETSLSDGRLTGTKTFVTMGAFARQVVVIFRRNAPEERPRLGAAIVDGSAPGVTFVDAEKVPFIPEVAHSRLALDAAPCAELDGDGYLQFVKPFRTVEDLCVHAAALAHLVGTLSMAPIDNIDDIEDRARALIEKSTAMIATLCILMTEPPLLPSTHVALAGVLRGFDGLLPELDAAFDRLGGDMAARWTRDKALFRVARSAREARRSAAWTALTTQLGDLETK